MTVWLIDWHDLTWLSIWLARLTGCLIDWLANWHWLTDLQSCQSEKLKRSFASYWTGALCVIWWLFLPLTGVIKKIRATSWRTGGSPWSRHPLQLLTIHKFDWRHPNVISLGLKFDNKHFGWQFICFIIFIGFTWLNRFESQPGQPASQLHR